MQVIDIGMGVLEITRKEFGDARSLFADTWESKRFHKAGDTAA